MFGDLEVMFFKRHDYKHHKLLISGFNYYIIYFVPYKNVTDTNLRLDVQIRMRG